MPTDRFMKHIKEVSERTEHMENPYLDQRISEIDYHITKDSVIREDVRKLLIEAKKEFERIKRINLELESAKESEKANKMLILSLSRSKIKSLYILIKGVILNNKESIRQARLLIERLEKPTERRLSFAKKTVDKTSGIKQIPKFPSLDRRFEGNIPKPRKIFGDDDD